MRSAWLTENSWGLEATSHKENSSSVLASWGSPARMGKRVMGRFVGRSAGPTGDCSCSVPGHLPLRVCDSEKDPVHVEAPAQSRQQATMRPRGEHATHAAAPQQPLGHQLHEDGPSATPEVNLLLAQTLMAGRSPSGYGPRLYTRTHTQRPPPPGPHGPSAHPETLDGLFLREIPGAFSTKMTLESCRKLWPDRTILFPPRTGQLATLCFSTRGSSWADRWAAGSGDSE